MKTTLTRLSGATLASVMLVGGFAGPASADDHENQSWFCSTLGVFCDDAKTDAKGDDKAAKGSDNAEGEKADAAKGSDNADKAEATDASTSSDSGSASTEGATAPASDPPAAVEAAKEAADPPAPAPAPEPVSP